MNWQACADIVRQGDPDRFLAAMASPLAARAVLFPIYAFNVEIARVPWVTSEPELAQIRHQWWREALAEIANGGPVRRHEVVSPLADVLAPQCVRLLSDLIDARARDIEGPAFSSEAELLQYLDRTGGGLMWAAALALGQTEGLFQAESQVRLFGQATAFARYLMATPQLAAEGREPFRFSPENCAARARKFRQAVVSAKEIRRSVPLQSRPALFEGWQTIPLLRKVERDPTAAVEGRVRLSEFRKRVGLLSWS